MTSKSLAISSFNMEIILHEKKIIELEKTNKTASHLSDFRALYIAVVWFLHLILNCPGI